MILIPRASCRASLVLVLAGCSGDAANTTGSTSGASQGTTTGASSSTGAETLTTMGAVTTTASVVTSSSSTTTMTTTTDADTSTTTGTTGLTDPTNPSTTGGDGCGCVADNQRILVLSDESEIWAYEPATDTFEMIADVICPGLQKPYSMAVDRSGVAWILYASDGQVYRFDPKNPAPCEFAGVLAGPAGFEFFGLSFAPASVDDTCDRLFLFNYSGEGPFAEGPGIGALGVFDPMTETVTKLGPTDFDGGELAGTGEGRLFAFAGVNPAKLIEYDQDSAQTLATVPLLNFRKTRASAFAFHGGDAYFFTEAVETTCLPCLEATCPADLAACQDDPVCEDALECSIALGDIQDNCGGLMPQAMVDCAVSMCGAACYPATDDVFSKVTRLDYDGSDGNGQVLSLVNPQAPIRIVGAAASTCAPYLPQ